MSGRGILRGGFGKKAGHEKDIHTMNSLGRGFGRGVLRADFSTDTNGQSDLSNDMSELSPFGKKRPGGLNQNGFGGDNSHGNGFGSNRGGFNSEGKGSDNNEEGKGFSKGGFGSGGRGGFGSGRGGDSGSGGDSGFGSSGGGFGSKGGGGGFGGGSKDRGDRPPRGGGFSSGGGSDGNCFKCQESGHMARECPNAPSGGGGGRDGKCFKCQETGHMARDCTNEENKDPARPPPYIPPAPTENEEEIFNTIQRGINFDKYDKIPVEVTGREVPPSIKNFEEAGLYQAFFNNVKKANYEKPTPVQKYSIPIVMAGRDLMACAQTGSGKTAAFLLPVLTGMMQEGLKSSQFSEVQEPQALVVAPTRELAVQIFMDARKFAHGTMLRAVVLYGGTSVGYQLRQVEQGAHIVVGTPGRLIDVISKGKISLSKLKYLILDEADRMLDMGFGPDIRKIVEELGTPPKSERQTLMFSATFPEEIQKLAGDFLNDYLFLTVGRVGGACSDVTQTLLEVERQEKRQKLCDILNASGTDKTLVFVEQKRNADFLASYLSQNDFPTTSIHGDRLQAEREEALRDFKIGKAPILIATSVAARGLDIPLVKHVINYDLPQSIDEYVHRIGRTGRCGNLGKATSFYTHDTDGGLAKALVRILADAMQEVPEWLETYAQSTQSNTGFSNYGTKFGGRDIRKDQPRKRETHKSDNGYPLGAGGGEISIGDGGDEENWD